MKERWIRVGVCDTDCALVNGCAVGGVQCRGCGRFVCKCDLSPDGFCDICDDERYEEGDAEE